MSHSHALMSPVKLNGNWRMRCLATVCISPCPTKGYKRTGLKMPYTLQTDSHPCISDPSSTLTSVLCAELINCPSPKNSMKLLWVLSILVLTLVMVTLPTATADDCILLGRECAGTGDKRCCPGTKCDQPMDAPFDRYCCAVDIYTHCKWS